MRRTKTAVSVVVTVLVAATAASATTVLLDAEPLAAGSASVGSCQAGGFTFGRTLDASKNVTAVTVGGITSGCAGGALTVVLVNSANTNIGDGTATIPGACGPCSVTVSISPQPLATTVQGYRLAIVGP